MTRKSNDRSRVVEKKFLRTQALGQISSGFEPGTVGNPYFMHIQFLEHLGGSLLCRMAVFKR